MFDVRVVVQVIVAEIVVLKGEAIAADDVRTHVPVAKLAVANGNAFAVLDQQSDANFRAAERRAVAVERDVIRHDDDGLMVLAVRRQRGILIDPHRRGNEQKKSEPVHASLVY